MDLTGLLLRLGAGRPHALVVPAPGAAATRVAVEAELARRGWPSAYAPAAADLLVVAGEPGPGLRAVVQRIWRQVPAPRALVELAQAADVGPALDAAAALVADREHQRRTAAAAGRPARGAGHGDDEGGHGPEGPTHGGEAGGHQHGDDGPDGQGDGGPGRGALDSGGRGERDGDHAGGHGGGDHGGHAGGHDGGRQHGGGHMHHGHMDHGGMSMAVAGLPMADLGEDRDGLTLDRLHVPLGPVLPDWPAGLVLRVTLQGDVVQEAAAEVLDAAPAETFWTGHAGRAARELDGLARFLGVAGWPSMAARARALRDDLVAGTPLTAVADRVRALVGTVRRSWVLRRQLRGLPVGGTDVAGLLERRLAAVEAALHGPQDAVRRPSVHESAQLLVGAELAAARLIVAALDPDTEAPDTETAAVEARHG